MHRRIILDEETEVQVLDNSAAKHKMAVRPRKTRPDSRTLAAAEIVAAQQQEVATEALGEE